MESILYTVTCTVRSAGSPVWLMVVLREWFSYQVLPTVVEVHPEQKEREIMNSAKTPAVTKCIRPDIKQM